MAYPSFETLYEYYAGPINKDETSTTWGFNLQMWNAFEAGQALITTNLATLQTQLQQFGDAGATQFQIQLPVSYNNCSLQQLGFLYYSFLCGVYYALQTQGIYYYYVQMGLDTTNSSITFLNLNFNFNPTLPVPFPPLSQFSVINTPNSSPRGNWQSGCGCP